MKRLCLTIQYTSFYYQHCPHGQIKVSKSFGGPKINYVLINIIYWILINRSRRGAGTCLRMYSRRLWIVFPLEGKKYLIFSFLPFGNDVKHSVDFRHLKRNAARILATNVKVSKWVPLPILLCAGTQHEVKKK